MKQYVPLFEYSTSQVTEDMAREWARQYMKVPYIEHMYGGNQDYPSQELGELLGVHIWHEWKMPYGWDENKTCRIFMTAYHVLQHTKRESKRDEMMKVCRDIAMETLRLNPEITTIPKATAFINDIMHGMVSRFNIEDIRFFIKYKVEGRPPSMAARSEKSYDTLRTAAEKVLTGMFTQYKDGRPFRTHNAMPWVASPHTIEMILNRIREIEKQKQ